VDATCHVCFREGFWHWELKCPDGTLCVVCTIPYTTAEEAERAMEDAAALLRAACESFFEKAKRAA
jgi:hypothetical protein